VEDDEKLNESAEATGIRGTARAVDVDGWESVRAMPVYCGKRSASICVVLGSKHSSTYSSEYASGCFEPAALHLPAAPLPRDEGLLGQTRDPKVKACELYQNFLPFALLP
jgi:hypothetical protein